MEKTILLPGTNSATEDRLEPQYHVVLLDDDDHTYEYVIHMLQTLFLFSHADALRHTVEVDTVGRTIVMTCELPQAEYARDLIHGFGADPGLPRSKGPMRAILEPAGGAAS
jgi:ATP-dependent Clp protease adaptor protein ClpS